MGRTAKKIEKSIKHKLPGKIVIMVLQLTSMKRKFIGMGRTGMFEISPCEYAAFQSCKLIDVTHASATDVVFQQLGAQRSPRTSLMTTAILQDGNCKLEVVFLRYHLRRCRDVIIDLDSCELVELQPLPFAIFQDDKLETEVF